MSEEVFVNHSLGKQAIANSGSAQFLLSNMKGSYAVLGDPSFSHHGGVFFFLPDEWTMFKTIENISLDVIPRSLTNKFYTVARESGVSLEEFFFFGNTFFYEVTDYEGDIAVSLDMRRVYDDDDTNRKYKVYFEEGCIVVEYAHNEEKFFLVVKGAREYGVVDKWFPRSYSYDALRDGLAERWVYQGLRFPCKGARKLSFTFGKDKEKAISDARVAFDEWELNRSRLKNFMQSVCSSDNVAFSSAVFALESQVMSLPDPSDRTGIYAGLPWFFHFWTRDELISLKGLILAEKYSLVKDILFKYVDGVLPDGRLPNRVPSAELGCADGVGWLWKRLGDFLTHLQKEDLLWQYFSKSELDNLLLVAEQSLRNLQKNHVVGDLVYNGPQETWMDTHGGVGDVRSGARVEIQALTLASFQTVFLLYKLAKRTVPKDLKMFQKSLLTAVRKNLVVKGVLADGFDGALDATVRPNVFLAYYIYPELLVRADWIKTFDGALEELWLEWGGLASLSRSHEWFVDSYVAKDDRSYHRGDSWYWVNNFAALAMRDLDKVRYSFHVKAITDASLKDLLWQGFVGEASELSSAAKQEPAGCLAQAWSAASLVELLYEKK